jgi:zinc/manganese transport system permease protein
MAVASALIVAIWFGWGARIGRTGFYLVFACAATFAVQLVGLYLVFATLIVPALATRLLMRGRIAVGYALAALSYAAGLALSMVTDLPAGPLIVCTMTVIGLAVFVLAGPARAALD